MPETSAPAAAPAAAPTPSAPSTPTTAGAAPPAQTPPSPSSSAQAPEPKPAFNDAFSEIDKIIAETQQKAPPPPGAKRPPKTAGQPDTKGDPTKTAEPKTEGAEPSDEEVRKMPPQHLHKAYLNVKSEKYKLNEQLKQAESKLKELEGKQPDPAELTKLQERISSAQKRAEELETELRFANYERSGEYKEKYYEPFVQAYTAARNKVGTLRIYERQNDIGEVTQQARKATPEDFDTLMRIQDDAEAAELADKLFGPMANLVIYHREKVQDLNSSRINAIDDYRKKGSEREAQQQTQSKELQTKLTGLFNEAKKKGIESHPQWFKAEDGDDQGRQLLEKGLSDADVLFGDGKMDPAERAMRHAAMRNKAGAFDYVALRLHRATQRITELEAELKEYKESSPGEGSQTRGEGTKAMTADEELDLIASGRK